MKKRRSCVRGCHVGGVPVCMKECGKGARSRLSCVADLDLDESKVVHLGICGEPVAELDFVAEVI